MKKTIVALLLIVALVASLCIGLVACNNDDDSFKIGLICLHDENSTYDANFINAMKEVQEELGLKDSQVIIVKGIPEDNECYEAAANLVDKGCDIIFADSFGHEPYIIQAATEFPEVQFCHATGTKAHTQGLNNYANAFASIYEGRYIAGVAAGMKLLEMYDKNNDGEIADEEAVVGYVGAFTYAEVMSGYTSFYIGVKEIVPNATMKVTFTGSWYDEKAEKAAANKLIQKGCRIISQHADSMGAPTACEQYDGDYVVPNITYNISTQSSCPNTFVIASRINWAPYYKYAIGQVQKGEAVDKDWTGSFATGSVEIIAVGNKAAAGTQEKVNELIEKFKNGEINVFSTDNFKVNGQKLTSYIADVDDAGDYVAETEVISNGVFQESEFRSAPYFNIQIDGIKLLDANYGKDANGNEQKFVYEE